MPRTTKIGRLPRLVTLAAVVMRAIAAPALAQIATGESASATPLRGTLNVAWPDGPPGTNVAAGPLLSLTTPDGGYQKLDVPAAVLRAAGGADALRGRTVELQANRSDGVSAAGRWSVRSMRATSGGVSALATAAVTGSQPYITLGCAFPENATRQVDVAYMERMYGSSPGQLNDYWNEVSYQKINVLGSAAADWKVLPKPLSAYSGTNPDLTGLFRDCVASHDEAVDFSRGGTGGFKGVNIFLNADIGCCAWGGAERYTLDGVNKSWSVTWLPPWATKSVTVVCHEMGHSLGLPHSNNSDGDGDTYDDPWDVMSDNYRYAVRDSELGQRGKHPHAYHKDRLGWFDESERYEADPDSDRTVTVAALEDASTSALRMVKVPDPRNAQRSYYVETRRQIGNYDAALPGKSAGPVVIISEVVTNRSEPDWVVDAASPAGDRTDSETVMWRTGEQFRDDGAGIVISIGALGEDGFQVRIQSGAGGGGTTSTTTTTTSTTTTSTTTPSTTTTTAPTTSTATPTTTTTTTATTTAGSARQIVGIASNRCLDVAGSNPADGTSVLLWDCNSGLNQRWTQVGSTLVNQATGKCLDVVGGGTANGTKVWQWTCIAGNTAQQWVINGNGALVNPASGRCLSARNQGTANNTTMQILDCATPGNHQLWRLT